MSICVNDASIFIIKKSTNQELAFAYNNIQKSDLSRILQGVDSSTSSLVFLGDDLLSPTFLYSHLALWLDTITVLD